MLLLGISFFSLQLSMSFEVSLNFSDNDVFLIKAGIYGPSIIEYIKDG